MVARTADENLRLMRNPFFTNGTTLSAPIANKSRLPVGPQPDIARAVFKNMPFGCWVVRS